MRLPLLLLCTGALAAADPPAPPPAPDAVPEITLVPSDFQLQTQQHFSPKGEPQIESRTCRLTLALRLHSNQLRMGNNRRNEQHPVVLTAALTDADESLLEDDQQCDLWVQEGYRGRQDNEPAATLNLMLKTPAKPFHSFKRLAGSVKLPLASGKLRRVDLKPLGTLSGTQVAIEGLEGMGLGVELRPDEVKLTCPSALFSLITEVKFFSADGQELSGHGSGSHGDNQSIEADYRVTVPADGSAVLFLLQKIQSVAIPFELEDVVIFRAAVPAKPATVIRSVEVENTDANVVPAGKSNF